MNQPLGIFDSGIGGLSVWKEIIQTLPNESTIYLSDSLHCPYGSKTSDEIITLAEKSTEFLLSKSCKIIVVACNTATAIAIEHLRNKYPVPFIGMEPAVKPAAIKSNNKSIGILATKGTFSGKHFKETSSKFAKGIKLTLQVGFGLVEHVEAADLESNELHQKLVKYIQPMLDNQADNIVLGCTHYPFLSDQIKKIAGNEVNIIDPSPAIARQTHFILKKHKLFSTNTDKPSYQFYTSGNCKNNSTILNKIIKGYQFKSVSI